jgi:hypothetical protein
MSSPSPVLPDVLALGLALALAIKKHAFSRKNGGGSVDELITLQYPNELIDRRPEDC